MPTNDIQCVVVLFMGIRQKLLLPFTTTTLLDHSKTQKSKATTWRISLAWMPSTTVEALTIIFKRAFRWDRCCE